MLSVFYTTMKRMQAYDLNSQLTDDSLAQLQNAAAKARQSSLCLLASAMRERYPTLPRPLVVARSARGKPYFRNYPEVHFNLSHSGAHLVCAVADAPVGVDVEVQKARDLRVAKRFFHQQEVQYLESLPKALQTKAFYDLWVLKEAYVKATGNGLHTPLSSFQISPSPPMISAPQKSVWSLGLLSQTMDDHISIGVCTQEINLPETCIFL